MTQQEILEYNERCLKILPFKYKNQSKYWVIYKYDDNSFFGKNRRYLAVNNLKFHSDWNLIMEVVYNILAQGFRKYTYTHEEYSRCVFTDMSILYQEHNFGGGNIVADSGKCSSEIEAVVHAINQFLIWYNDKSKEKT